MKQTGVITVLALTALLFRTSVVAQNPEEMPLIKPLFDGALRDPSICIGPDGTYYLTGTTADNPAPSSDTTGWWYVNEGIRIWKSRDLKNWEPLGLVWSLDKDATWAKEYKSRRGVRRRATWAPEIFYMKGTFWLTYSMNYRGCGLLKSTSGKPEGPYADVKTDGPLTGNIDASLFQDEDGKVYFIYQNGMIAQLNEKMTELVEEPRLLKPANHDDVGFEGAFMTKYNGKYILICAEFNVKDSVRTYDCMVSVAENIYGPYGDRVLAIPHGGHNMLFKTNEGQWMSTFFGVNKWAAFMEKPGILPIEFDSEGRFRPLLKTSAPDTEAN
jgi:xylan 1,4-beta-xylosidase